MTRLGGPVESWKTGVILFVETTEFDIVQPDGAVLQYMSQLQGIRYMP